MRLATTSRLTPLFALLALAACSDHKIDRNPVSPSGIMREAAGTVQYTYVCAWGPEGTYNFDVMATNVPAAGTLYNGNAPVVTMSLSNSNAANVCVPIWEPLEGGGATTLTITSKSAMAIDSVRVRDLIGTPIALYAANTKTITWPDAAHSSYVVDATHGYNIKFYYSPSCQDQDAMNFGETLPCVYGRLGDFVWNDKNNDGIQGLDETGMPRVTVDLLLCNNGNCSAVGTTTTDQDGHYLFDHIGAHEYHVCAATPDGFMPSASLQGGDPAKDSNGCPASTTLSQNRPEDLTLDFGFVLKPTQICSDPTATNNGQPGACEYPIPACPAGAFTFGYAANGDLLIRYDQFPAPNDNSYGVNAVGWPNGHKFGDLVGSDHAGFQLVDAAGKIRLSFNVDYLTAFAGAPSGYKSLGVSGGDGKMVVGTADGITATTSLDRNLNGFHIPGLFNASHVQQFGSVNVLVNSPPTDAAHQTYDITDPTLAAWDFHDTYFVTISSAKLASLGFDRNTWRVEPNLANLHNSPAKPCPPGPASIEVLSYNVKDKQVLVTIKNTGGSAVYLTNLTLDWPESNGSLTQIKLDGDVVYDTPDLASGPISLTTTQLVADQNKRKIDPGTSDVYTLIFQSNANTDLSLYTGSVTFSGLSLTVLPH